MKDIVKSQTNAEVKIINGKKVKLHRRSRRSNVTTYTAVAVAVITTIGLILSLCFFFNLKQVAVNGVTLYTNDQILEVGGVVNGANLFRTNTDIIEQRLVDTLPYVESAKVTKDFPNSLVIEIEEAMKACEIEKDGKYFVVSESGRLLEADNLQHNAELPLVQGFELTSPEVNKEIESSDKYKSKVLMQVLEDINSSDIGNITVIDMTKRTDIVLWYEDRLELRVGSTLDMDYKLTNMKYVIEGKLPEDYEGTLRYNGSDTGISAIPKGAQTTRPRQTVPEETEPADQPGADAAEPADGGTEEPQPAETQAPAEEPEQTQTEVYRGWEETEP